MKTHGMGDKLPAKQQTGDIYQYANKETYKPYSVKLNLHYTIKSSSDTTFYYYDGGGENSAPVKLKGTSATTFSYDETVSATCNALFALIRNTGSDTHFDLDMNHREKGVNKDDKFVITGNITSKSTKATTNEALTGSGIKTLTTSEKTDLQGYAFEQEPEFQFHYDVEEGNSKPQSELNFAFQLSKAKGTATKTDEKGITTDIIKQMYGTTDLESNIAQFMLIGLPQQPLQGEVNNKKTISANTDSNAMYATTTQAASGMGAIAGNDATIDKTPTGYSLKKSNLIDKVAGKDKLTISWQLEVLITEVTQK